MIFTAHHVAEIKLLIPMFGIRINANDAVTIAVFVNGVNRMPNVNAVSVNSNVNKNRFHKN